MEIKRIIEMISEEELNKRIVEMGRQISEDFAGKRVKLVCVLKGGVFFACELAKRMSVDVALDFMSVSSYGNEVNTTGAVKIIKDLDDPIEGEHIIVVEDIIDSGVTLNYLLGLLRNRNPKSLTLCTLLDKPERRIVDVDVDYVGFEIPDEFVVGFGLDCAQQYRNLPYIARVELA